MKPPSPLATSPPAYSVRPSAGKPGTLQSNLSASIAALHEGLVGPSFLSCTKGRLEGGEVYFSLPRFRIQRRMRM